MGSMLCFLFFGVHQTIKGRRLVLAQEVSQGRWTNAFCNHKEKRIKSREVVETSKLCKTDYDRFSDRFERSLFQVFPGVKDF